jgi:hypothetical protein
MLSALVVALDQTPDKSQDENTEGGAATDSLQEEQDPVAGTESGLIILHH